MSTTRRGPYTRILPWAALALMVVFFFMQVAARNRAEYQVRDLEEQLRAKEGGETLMPATAIVSSDAAGELTRMSQALAAAEARAEDALARLDRAATELERTEAVRSTEAARVKALSGADAGKLAEAQAALRSAQGMAEGARLAWALQREELANALEAARREAARATALATERAATIEDLAGEESALIVQRDALMAELATAEAELRSQRGMMEGARAAWAMQREETQGAMNQMRTALTNAGSQNDALRAALAEVQASMERMLRQARENQERIATLSRMPRTKAATASDHVDHWLRSITDDAERSGLARKRLDETHAALRAAWTAESADGRAARADAYVTLLNALPRSEESLATARRLTTIGMVPDAVLARMIANLSTTHLTDPHSWTTFLLRGGPAVRVAILKRLRRDAARWSDPERAALGRALRSRLRDRKADMRRDAAWGLGALAHEGAATALVRLLKDEDAGVRNAAAWAITRLKRSPATVEPLKKYTIAQLDSPVLEERGEAIRLAEWVLDQPQNTSWLELTDPQIRRIADRLRRRLEQ